MGKSRADELAEMLSQLQRRAREHERALSDYVREVEWLERTLKQTGCDEYGNPIYHPPTVEEVANVAFWLAELSSDISADLDDAIKELERLKVVRPRLADRDAEIVRLRDDEELSFGEIRREIRKQKQWANMQNGKPVTVAAIKAAYKRASRAN